MGTARPLLSPLCSEWGEYTPEKIRLSCVSVPVLSKASTSTLPPKMMRKGSVQKMRSPLRISSELLTARESCTGSSGGTTLVKMMDTSTNSL